MKRRIGIPLRSGSVTIVIDDENNQVWKEYFNNKGELVPVEIHNIFALDDPWIKSLWQCKICGGPVDDEHFAWAFWSLKQDYCSTKCWTVDHGGKEYKSNIENN